MGSGYLDGWTFDGHRPDDGLASQDFKKNGVDRAVYLDTLRLSLLMKGKWISAMAAPSCELSHDRGFCFAPRPPTVRRPDIRDLNASRPQFLR